MKLKKINDYEFSKFSQNGEDGIIEFFVKKLKNNNKFFVELGCSNGLQNNSRNLIENGWSGILCDMPLKINSFISLLKQIKPKLPDSVKICVRVNNGETTEDLDDFFNACDYAMIELDSKVIVDEKIVDRAKSKNCEPIYLALMPTLMKGQVQSREENFEIGHTLEEGFDMIALYEETANGPYPARSVKCIDEIAVESEKLRVNPFSDLMSKIFGFFKK